MRTPYMFLIFLAGVLLIAPTAFADTVILQTSSASDYSIGDDSPTIVTTPSTFVSNDLTLTSMASDNISLILSVACYNVDESCNWAEFLDGSKRMNLVLEPLEIKKIGYTVVVPPDANMTNYRFNIIIQKNVLGSVNVRIVPVSLQMGQAFDVSKISFLDQGVELPQPCLRYANETVNGTTAETCVQKVFIPIWFIIILFLSVILVAWKLR